MYPYHKTSGAQPPPRGARPSNSGLRNVPTEPRAMRQPQSLTTFHHRNGYNPSPWGPPQLGQGYWRMDQGYFVMGAVGFPRPTPPPPPRLNQAPFHSNRIEAAQYSAHRGAYMPAQHSDTTTTRAYQHTSNLNHINLSSQVSRHVPTRSHRGQNTTILPGNFQASHHLVLKATQEQDANPWTLTEDRLEPGMVVQTKSSRDGWSDHPGIVLEWDGRGTVTVIQVTGFGKENSTVYQRFNHIVNPNIARDLASTYLLIADEGNTPPHCRLPVLRLKHGEFMPKRSYVNFHVILKLHISMLMFFTGGRKFVYRCLTEESMMTLREHRVRCAAAVKRQKE